MYAVSQNRIISCKQILLQFHVLQDIKGKSCNCTYPVGIPENLDDFGLEDTRDFRPQNANSLNKSKKLKIRAGGRLKWIFYIEKMKL